MKNEKTAVETKKNILFIPLFSPVSFAKKTIIKYIQKRELKNK